jgi:hypothetical protein
MATSAVDLVVAAFGVLSPAEQASALQLLNEIRVERLAGDDAEFARHLDSLRRAAAFCEGELSAGRYREARTALLAEGVELIDINQHVRLFGSWSRAMAALALDKTETPAKIEARLRKRLRGRPRSYRSQELGQALAACKKSLGRVPLVAEYEKWRMSMIELARHAGQERFIPSAAPFRRRFGTFERALVHFGYSPEQTGLRYEEGLGAADS